MIAGQLKITSIALLLVLTSCETPQDSVMGFVTATYDAQLTGNGVAGAGDPDGYGVAQLAVQRDIDAVCYNVWNVRGIDNPTSAHIHRGEAGENGPVIATLERNGELGWNGCNRDAELLRELSEMTPEGFYVQVHTVEYPAGAIRGQLTPD